MEACQGGLSFPHLFFFFLKPLNYEKFSKEFQKFKLFLPNPVFFIHWDCLDPQSTANLIANIARALCPLPQSAHFSTPVLRAYYVQSIVLVFGRIQKSVNRTHLKLLGTVLAKYLHVVIISELFN